MILNYKIINDKKYLTMRYFCRLEDRSYDSFSAIYWNFKNNKLPNHEYRILDIIKIKNNIYVGLDSYIELIKKRNAIADYTASVHVLLNELKEQKVIKENDIMKMFNIRNQSRVSEMLKNVTNTMALKAFDSMFEYLSNITDRVLKETEETVLWYKDTRKHLKAYI
jgi:hypothetical protein